MKVRNSALPASLLTFLAFSTPSAWGLTAVGSTESYISLTSDTNPVGTYYGNISPSTSLVGTIELGASPLISLASVSTSSVSADQGTFTRSGGGVRADLWYQFEYVTQTSNSPVLVHASAFATSNSTIDITEWYQGANTWISGFLTVGMGSYNDFYGCIGSNSGAGGGGPDQPIPKYGTADGCSDSPIKDFDFWLTPNQLYTVHMHAQVDTYATSGASATADVTIDPTFSILGEAPSDGYFLYSEGVTAQSVSAIPEPGELALFGLGLGCLAAVSRRRRTRGAIRL